MRMPGQNLGPPWFVYVLECAGRRLYTGITTDPEARFRAHLQGKGAAFTRAFRPERFLAIAKCPDKAEASRLEWQIKRLPRKKKVKAIKNRPWKAPR